MKVLFIGGTGNLSSDCTLRALAKGMEVWHLNRGNRSGDVPAGVVSLGADVRDEEAVARLLGGERFDAVVDWMAEPRQGARYAGLYPAAGPIAGGSTAAGTSVVAGRGLFLVFFSLSRFVARGRALGSWQGHRFARRGRR